MTVNNAGSYPQFSAAARQGERGVNVVARIVAETFGWLFKRNHQEHDFGIDGQIEVISDGGFVTGQMCAAQVKCGASFVQEENQFGYVFRGQRKHFNFFRIIQFRFSSFFVVPTPKSVFGCVSTPYKLSLPRRVGRSPFRLQPVQ